MCRIARFQPIFFDAVIVDDTQCSQETVVGQACTWAKEDYGCHVWQDLVPNASHNLKYCNENPQYVRLVCNVSANAPLTNTITYMMTILSQGSTVAAGRVIAAQTLRYDITAISPDSV